jgi:hypothetical protein
VTDDRWLDRVVTALRDRQPPSPELTARILERVRVKPPRPAGAARWMWVATGLVAAAAALLAVRPSRVPPPIRTATTNQKSIAFAIDAGAASRVSLVGDFNNWDRAGTPMTRDRGGEWHATVALPVGIYRYAFLVDDARWMPDPAQAVLVDHDFDQPTSVVTVQ